MADPWSNDNEAWQDDPTPWDYINLHHNAGCSVGQASAVQSTFAPSFTSGVLQGYLAEVQGTWNVNAVYGSLVGMTLDYSRTQHVDFPSDVEVGFLAGTQTSILGDFASGFLQAYDAGVRFPWDDDVGPGNLENWEEVNDGSLDESWNEVPDGNGGEAWTPV